MPKIKGLSHVVLYVNDLDKMVAFYRDVLGLIKYHEHPGRMVFMTPDPEIDDHQLALAKGREGDAKILAHEVSHKTELGGVQLDIADEQALALALAKLDAIPLTSPRRYLIEEMAPPGLELPVELEVGAAAENFLRSTFGNHAVHFVGSFDHHRHDLA